MNNEVDLIWFGDSADPPRWPLGKVWPSAPTPRALFERVQEQLKDSTARAWLFWDGALGAPDVERVQAALSRPGEVWHAGLRLGTGGWPGLLDFVLPTWMLNRDPDPSIEATSWRLSLRACLVTTEVLRQMGCVQPEFQTLAGAALELGCRYAMHGVLTRHLGWLAPADAATIAPAAPLDDELRFIYYRFGRNWSRWAVSRAVMTRYISPGQTLRAWRRVLREPRPAEPKPFTRESAPPAALNGAQVSVLIPTLERYPYIRALLGQLRQQTVKPLEIIIVDQTQAERRETKLADEFSDLPIKYLQREQPGQCSSRNAGLRLAAGDYVLFIDDDDEVPPTLIEAHLQSLRRFQANVSCGVADEVGAEPLAKEFTYIRPSNVFPTNNTLIRKDALRHSGLFDLAYERGQRADGDLGMRVYLSGALMVLNPEISVLHHHAPSGGLRVHKARVVTYSSSRQKLMQRHLPSVTEIYLARRYFSARQAREMLWLRAAGTFSARGSRPKKMLKCLVSLFYLPDTVRQIRERQRQAMRMLEKFPQIPDLGGSEPSAQTEDGALSALT